MKCPFLHSKNFLAFQQWWKMNCQSVKAAQCAHMLQAACLYGPPLSNPSIAIHPLPPCLCLSVSCTVLVLADGQRRVVGDQKCNTWTMNHHGPQHRNTPVTAPFTSLPAVIPIFFTLCTCSFLWSVFFASLLSLCSSGCPSCYKLDERRPWCVQTFMTVGEREEMRGVIVVALWLQSQIVYLFVTKWVMMTKHFILVQWVRYSSCRAVMMADESGDNTGGIFLWHERHRTKKGLCKTVCQDEGR